MNDFAVVTTLQPLPVQTNDQWLAFCTPPNLPHLDPGATAAHQADAHWLLLDSRNAVVARCSLWWRQPPAYADHRPGLIGHYAAVDRAAAAQLLQLSCAQLAAQNCTIAIGPMDGNTWRRYRLVVEHGDLPSFFLEPDNPSDWPDHFTASGFTILSNYVSTITDNLTHLNSRLDPVARRAAAQGVTIRPLNLDDLDADLHRIYSISTAAFARNFLYTPIEEADFVAMYRPLRPYLRPELILIAEQADQPIGFIFALPDLEQARRSQRIDTVIIKTVAVCSSRQIGGLGSLLVDRCQQIAHDLGYSRAIHALMHEANDSRNISRRYHSNVIRRYALFGKTL
ncbi:MAG: GNAT family N-acetyltransferase [Anaerolineales bacterium]|nr:GNAT family N-acetyltransferase [Anaerolineales bacterium]